MIKLTDLIDEIELRTGTLNIPKTEIIKFFFDDYGLPYPGNRVFSKKVDIDFTNSIRQQSTVIAEVGDFTLLQPEGITGHYFLVNESAAGNEAINDFGGYLAGFVDADVLSLAEKNLAPYQMKGIEIHLTFVFEGYRGMGLGGIMYQMLLQAYKTVFSDSILYKASRSVWISKLAPMANGSSIIFGGRYSNTIVPLTVEDAENDVIAEEIDKYFITINPPSPLKKITKAIGGLSLSKGEYGIYQPSYKMKAKDIDNISSKVNSIEALIDVVGLERVVGIGDPTNYQKIVIEAENVVLVADELGDVEPI